MPFPLLPSPGASDHVKGLEDTELGSYLKAPSDTT